MSRQEMESLMGRGKRYVQQVLTAGCYDQVSEKNMALQPSYVDRSEHLHDHRKVLAMIDWLFDYRNTITQEEMVEWVKLLLSGRRLPNNFAAEVKRYDTSSKCGLVWTTNFVAYRCRTCAISLCMSLCTDCFLNGNHEGHDFNMFRSQAGGACDCGDSFVMHEQGFCRHHKPKRAEEVQQQSQPPISVLCIPKDVIPRLLYYLVLYLREDILYEHKKANALLADILIYLNDLGTLMQSIICDALTDTNLYKTSLNPTNATALHKEDDLEYLHRLRTLADNYRKAVQEIQLSSIFPNVDTSRVNHHELMKDFEAFKPELVHNTFLDEIIFWTILKEFPSNLITFLLKMLPNDTYKEKFAESFVKHYFRISMLILHPPERFGRNIERDIFYNKLAQAVVHVSVQLFSNENLSLLLCDQLKLLYVIIGSLKYAVEGNRLNHWGILIPNTLLKPVNQTEKNSNHRQLSSIESLSPRKALCDKVSSQGGQSATSSASTITTESAKSDSDNVPRVVRCDHTILRLHRFWPMVSDLNNLFTHQSVAIYFLKDDVLVDLWLEFVMSFQAMNLNEKLTQADDDNVNYKSAYLAELEICASQMWTLLSHLTCDSSALSVKFIKQIYKWLEKWLEPLEGHLQKIDNNVCTFHLPLHRYFSVFAYHAVTYQNVSLDSLLPEDPYKLQCLIAHPLQTLVGFYHIMAGLWVHNGLQIRTQALNYMQSHFCSSTIDADIFLIQQVATRLGAEKFIDLFVNTYGLKPHMYISPDSTISLEEDKLIAFIENAFTFLATLVSVNINLDIDPQAVTRKEMVALLVISEKTHSQIHDMLPYKSSIFSKNAFSNILNDIADYKSPEVEASGGLVQGHFYPKCNIWREEYDPLFILYRNSFRRDFQTSLDRFASNARKSGKYHSKGLPWPPFRIPGQVDSHFTDPRNILNSKLLNAFYFSILVKALNDSPIITQHLLSIVIYLMELTLIEADKNEQTDNTSHPCQLSIIESVIESEFENWFPTANLLDNFLVTIKKIKIGDFNIQFNNENSKSNFLRNLVNSIINEDYSFYQELSGYPGSVIVDDGEAEVDMFGLNMNLLNAFLHDARAAENLPGLIDVLRRMSPSTVESMGQEMDFFNLSEETEDEPDERVGVEENEGEYEESNASTLTNHEVNPDLELSPMVELETISSPSEASTSASISTADTSSTQSESSSSTDRRQSRHSRTPSLDLSHTKPFSKQEHDINESFLSLLLKLYSKMSAKSDAFKTDSISLASFDLASRTGDGSYFVGCLLKRYIMMSAKRLYKYKLLILDSEKNTQVDEESCLVEVIQVIDKIRQRIWSVDINSTESGESPNSNANKVNQNSGDIVIGQNEDVDMVELERLERKRRALEVKQQILNKFRSMQDAFIQNNKDLQESTATINTENKVNLNDHEMVETENTVNLRSTTVNNDTIGGGGLDPKYQPENYYCVICDVTGCSTLERSFVQMVLFQPTSVLGNARAHTLTEELDEFAIFQEQLSSSSSAPESTDLLASNLPTANDELNLFAERRTLADYFEQRVDTLHNTFALDSWLSSFNIGWCGGVHAQSCGHFMHMDCYQSYMDTVYRFNREGAPDLLEYNCPLCRKMANSVLPIIPNFANLYAMVKSRTTNNPHGVALEILELLSNCDTSRLANTTEDESKFLKVLSMSIEDVMKATEPQYRNIRVDPCPPSLFLFLSSISRTNLENNILLWRDNLLRTPFNASCFVHLFQALSLNAKLVLPMHYTRVWSQITGINLDDDNGANLVPFEKQVPLLLKDVSAILLQFLCALPFNIDKAYFISIMQALLNLNFIQALVLIAYQMPPEQRIQLKTQHLTEQENGLDTYAHYIGAIMNCIEPNSLTELFLTVENRPPLSDSIVLHMIAKICLPFLRVASMLFYLLYQPQCSLPDYQSIKQQKCKNLSSAIAEFCTLANFLHLNNSSSNQEMNNLTNSTNLVGDHFQTNAYFKPYINWIQHEPCVLVTTWYKEFEKFVQANTMAARSLIKESFVICHMPRLLRLPHLYEQLFMFYHKRTCIACNQVPKDPCVCLICGRLVCIRENCCRSGRSYEGTLHSKKCGAGVAIYLTINSSSIIVILGRKACIWGSVYLDEYGEEDRDLKRGKPLFLCKERYAILEQQWLLHGFPNANKKWIYHKDSL